MSASGKRPVAAQSGSSAPRIVGALGTNLGATQTVTFTGAEEVWLLGTLNANLTITLASRAAGARCKLIAVQDATGSRTVAFSDGSTSQAVSVTSTALAGVEAQADCPNSTDVTVFNPGGSGPTGPTGATGPTGPTGSTGPAGLAWQGAWVSGTTYAVNDAVSSAGASYRRLIAGAGTTAPLSDTTNWAVIAAKGSDGAAGGGMTNPMTTLDDIIVGGSSGTPARVAKGSNNTVWGVNGSGVLGYKADPAGGGSTENIPWLPIDSGLLATTCDPSLADATNVISAGFVQGARIVIRKAITVAKLGVIIRSAGSGLTAGQSLAGIWDIADASLIAKTADQVTNWGSTGYRDATLTAESGKSLTLTAGMTVFAGVLSNGTTRPGFAHVNGINSDAIGIGGSGVNFRAGYSPSSGALTALPTTLATVTADQKIFFVALSA